MASTNDAVVVLETADSIELGLACDLLKQKSIPHIVSGGSTSSLMEVYGGQSWGGVRSLFVRPEDVDRVLDLFDETWGPEPQDEESEADPGESSDD